MMHDACDDGTVRDHTDDVDASCGIDCDEDYMPDAEAAADALCAGGLQPRESAHADALEVKLESRLHRHKKRRDLADGFKRNKVVNEVLDRPTIMTLYKMITDGILSGVNGSISAGKESLVFWGLDGAGKDVALKIYLVSTSNFKRRQEYIRGDPRFASVRRGTRNIVYAWARKEYRNLIQCDKAGVPVPLPIRVANNVLAMEFVKDADGPCGRPAQRLVDCHDTTCEDYQQAVSILRRMYSEARLVHGDYSEYNIFRVPNRGLVVFDLGSAVDTRHPSSTGLLQRDINNITRFFKKRGIDVDNDTVGMLESMIK